MTNQWFRSWHGAPTDPKWLGVARKAGVAPGIVSALVWALLDRASQASERGSIAGYDADGLACFMGCEAEEVEHVIAILHEKGVLNNNVFTGWDKHQPKREDNSTDRVREYRERKKVERNADETQCNAVERPETLDTDTDTDTEVNLKKARGARIADDWVPDDASERKAAELGFTGHDLRTEIERFKNYWIAKSGAGAVKLDWQRTFQNWLINASKFQTSRRNVIGLDQRNRDDFKARKEREEWEIFQRHLVK